MATKTPLHLVFVDFRKAFDSVRHDKLLQIIEEFGLPPEATRLIADLYQNANGTLQWKGLVTPSFETPVGVRQGCPLSPALFNLYTEAMMREWTQKIEHLRIRPPDVDGAPYLEERYADDLAFFGRTAEDATTMLEVLDLVAADYGLILHPGKTEHMPINSADGVSLHGVNIKRVASFRYLGCNVNNVLDDSSEIRSRLAMGRRALNSCPYLKKNHVSVDTKLHLARALIMSKVLYGASTWTIKAADAAAIDAFGRDMWRTLLDIKWDDFISNAELARRIGRRWCLTTEGLMKQQYTWLGHFQRHTANQTLISGLPEGSRRPPGRPRLRWLDGLRRHTGSKAEDIIDAATNRQPMPSATHRSQMVLRRRHDR